MFNDQPEQYIWWSYRTKARNRNVGWRLDYFFVNEEFKENVVDFFILSDVMGFRSLSYWFGEKNLIFFKKIFIIFFNFFNFS